MRKICFVTGSRAEYGIMSHLMHRVSNDSELQFQLIVTNMHLSPEYGLTYKEIESDGLHIDKKVEMLLSSDTDCGTVKSMGVELIGMADALNELNPDLLVVLGDRYEILMAASAAMIMKIPVAHLSGGEITEGAYDDAIRHAITKIASLHFPTTDRNRQRIIQMGEQPDRVFCFGSLAIDNMKREEMLSKSELEESLQFSLGEKSMHVAYHPVTMECGTAEQQITDLLSALEDYNDYQIIFTYPNSDGGGRIIRKKIDEFVSTHPNSRCYASLGRKRYYSLLSHITLMIGNSSSGLIEAPSFKIPTLNIGDRQKGRTQGNTVINCNATIEGIKEGLAKASSSEFINHCREKGISPFDKPNAVENYYKVLKSFPLNNLKGKHFYHSNILKYLIMYKGKRILGIVPARGGSKGLPGKNIRPLLGKPLIGWSIEQAKASKLLDEIYVSTDSQEIADVCEQFGVKVPELRPAELASDTAPSSAFIVYTIELMESRGKHFDYIALMEPTSPLRDPEDIDNAIMELIDKGQETIVGVCESEASNPSFLNKINPDGTLAPYEGGFKTKRRQEIEPVYFHEGSIYVSSVESYLRTKAFYHEHSLPYIVPKWKSFEIDDIVDFMVIEAIMKLKQDNYFNK